MKRGGARGWWPLPSVPPFFCVRGGAGLPMFMRSKFGLVATPPCPLFFSCLKEREWGVLTIPYAHAHGHARCCALPCLLYCPWAHAHAPCPCPCPCALGWWPPPSCPLFSFEGRGFFLEVGGGLGWLPHHPFSPLTTDPMVERAERQTFAPKVAGSSPTGTLCERRDEKTLSGLLPLSPLARR